MRRLLIILLALLLVTPADAGEFIGEMRYTIPGAEVVATFWCRDDFTRVSIYALTATDTEGRTYWVDVDTDAPGIVASHTGLIRVDGHLITWLPHKVKATATITISGDPCYRMIEDIEARVVVYLPLIVR
jgi:hypothetical protein